MTDTTAPALGDPRDQRRLLRVNTLIWIGIAIGVTLQEVALHSLAGRHEPLVPGLLWKLVLLPFWAAATPFIIRSAARWPLAGPARVGNLGRHGAWAILFIVATNAAIRIPRFFWPGQVDAKGFVTNLAGGLAFYGPFALIVYAAIVAIGSWLDATAERPEQHTAGSAEAPDHAEALALREGEVLKVVPVAEIDWVEADDNYVRVAAGGRFHRGRERLAAIEALLDPDQFVRIHRSAIVRLASVRAVVPVASGDWAVDLVNGVRLRVARGRRRALEAALAARTGGLER